MFPTNAENETLLWNKIDYATLQLGPLESFAHSKKLKDFDLRISWMQEYIHTAINALRNLPWQIGIRLMQFFPTVKKDSVKFFV